MKLVLALIVIAGLIAAAPANFTTAETSGTTPIPDDQPLLAGIPGLEDAAIRAIQSDEIKQRGPIVLTFEVIRCSDEKAAKANLPELVRRVVARFDADRNGADPYQAVANPPTLGDETVVYAGEQRYDEPIGEIEASPVTIVFVRTGVYLHIAVGLTMRGDALQDLIDILRITTNRHEGGNATPTNASGHYTGGLWDLLPTLDDLPPDYSITDEIIPEPFVSSPSR